MHTFTIWKSIIWLGLLHIARGQTTTSGSGAPAQCPPLHSPSPTITISSQGEAAAFASPCPYNGGSILIAPNVTEDLTFTGLQSIAGDVVMQDMLTSPNIYFPDLQTVNGSIWLVGGQASSHVAFNSLKSTASLLLIDWDFTPSNGKANSLRDMLAAGSLPVFNSTTLRNTTLTDITLPAANPAPTLVSVLDNKRLRSLKLSGSIADLVKIDNNGDPSQADPISVDLTRLTSLGRIAIANNWKPNISDIPGLSIDLTVKNNTGMQAFSLPNLSTLKGSLNISINPDLVQISLPRLASVQNDLRIEGNNRLLSAGDLPSLKVVSGSVILAGPISNITYDRQLALVAGAFTLDSTTNFPCGDLYKTLTANKVLQNGTFGCRSVNDTSGQSDFSGSAPGTTSSDSSHNSLSVGAIVGIVVAAVVLCAIVLLGGYCCWRRRRRQRQQTVDNQTRRLSYDTQSPGAQPYYMNGPPPVHEMGTDGASELATKVHTNELPTNPAKPGAFIVDKKIVRESPRIGRTTPYEMAG